MKTPLAVHLQGRPCVVVGGGAVAERRTGILLHGGAAVTVLSPELTPGLRLRLEKGEFDYVEGSYEEEKFAEWFLQKPPFLVVAATNSRSVNERVFQQCKEVVPLINIVDNQAASTFHFPAVMEQGPLQIAVTTSGLSPLLGKKIVEELSEAYGEEYGVFLQRLGVLREKVLKEVEDSEVRREILKAVVNHKGIVEKFRQEKIEAGDNLITEIVDKFTRN
ncbi:precorrin-2 dehydrogenase/sirohydrochlorin ferrochelatase [Evansella vedderi]|uniref:precorrin-2 dehydrogenase n=1 Tax=Evansella vedderi TaxID=38282 RepID=A0ABT9ZZE3_9BACI|nr:bifunctional precorrin-2 dehydrogenase/sirohydrochlorin ferrochelatase [Evansella vedderi]MDQ0256612.1 precorrin-2 dehydrogenase/sirohydrochlorin ferrochelatase [Evansella vedderi]